MKYISTVEASKKWNISSRRITNLCKEGRIEGAIQMSLRWMIPEDALKPEDARFNVVKNKETKDEVFFRYPCFEGMDLNSFDPPLTPFEIKYTQARQAFYSCCYEEAHKIIEELKHQDLNICERIFLLYASCACNFAVNNYADFYDAITRLNAEVKKDIPYKTELTLIAEEINLLIGNGNYYITKFNVNPSYSYNKSFLPHLATLCMVSYDYSIGSRIYAKDLIPYEYMASELEGKGYYPDLQTIHMYLGICYCKINMRKEMVVHFKKALDIAYKYNLFYTVADLYFYYNRLMDEALNDFPEEFIEIIQYHSEDIHQRYIDFIKIIDPNNADIVLSSKDYIYVIYASIGYSNKEVASLLNISESNVGNRYSEIYQKLNISSKAELVGLYNKTIRGIH